MSKHTDVQTTSEYHEVIFSNSLCSFFFSILLRIYFPLDSAQQTRYPWNFECRPYHI